MNVYELIPKNKFDNSNIEKLKQLTAEEISPILPNLLIWIQDGNWPVYHDILAVLVLHQVALAPHILNILRAEERDAEWKYFIIAGLAPLYSDANLPLLLPAIKRIAEHPTPDEIDSEADEMAADFLQKRGQPEK